MSKRKRLISRWFETFFRRRNSHGSLTFSPQAFSSLCEHLRASAEIGHEGIIYLLGAIEGSNVFVQEIFSPRAETTPGSFHVPLIEMARMVQRAVDAGYLVVGQVHTHPGHAYHSEGDLKGMDLRHDGYVSLVLPRFGRDLPSLRGMHALQFSDQRGWTPLPLEAIQK